MLIFIAAFLPTLFSIVRSRGATPVGEPGPAAPNRRAATFREKAPKGRPTVARAVRDLIRGMCRENPSWGAPRIHGELLKLGINIAEARSATPEKQRPCPLFAAGKASRTSKPSDALSSAAFFFTEIEFSIGTVGVESDDSDERHRIAEALHQLETIRRGRKGNGQ
jgi:hypothetical protein